jgi:hypothetical protein
MPRARDDAFSERDVVYASLAPITPGPGRGISTDIDW